MPHYTDYGGHSYSDQGEDTSIDKTVDNFEINSIKKNNGELVNFNGDIDWFNSFGEFDLDNSQEGNNSINVISSVSSDSNNIFIAGGTNINLNGVINSGDEDAFLIKLDSDGNEIWTKLFGTDKEDLAYSVNVSEDGFVYLSGETKGDLNGVINSGDEDAFLIKLDSDGNEIWTKLFGTQYSEIPWFSNIDNYGNILLGGETAGNLNGEINNGIIEEDGNILDSEDAFLIKVDPDGNEIWTKLFGTEGGEELFSAVTSNDGSIYITGETRSDHFGSSEPYSFIQDGFVAKLEPNGNKIWESSFGTGFLDIQDSEELQKLDQSDTSSYAIDIDNDGFIYLAGVTNLNLNGQINQGSDDAFLMKFDQDGNKIWTKLFGTESYDYASGLKVDDDGNILISGGTYGNLNNQDNHGEGDGFVIKLDQNGNEIWTKLFGTEFYDENLPLNFGNNGEIYLPGYSDNNYSSVGFIYKLNDDLDFEESVLELGENIYLRENSIYTIVDGPSWIEAEVNANKLGGHLVTINNQEENDFIEQISFDNSSQSSWIGLSDVDSNGIWEWSSNLKSDYSNWDVTQNQPNGGPQLYAGIIAGSLNDKEKDDEGREAGSWHDYRLQNEPSKPHIGISETPFIRRGDSAYLIVEGPTWEEAEANANKLGGHLVTIDDAEENQFLIDNFTEILSSPDPNWNNELRAEAWIGLSNSNNRNELRWSSGELLNYEYFPYGAGQGEINQEYIENNTRQGYYLHIVDPSGHAQRHGGLEGWWYAPIIGSDYYGENYPYFWTNNKGIAEIKIPLLNQDPTGTPLLRGDFIPGEIIDVDLSGVSDPDNHEGFTPVYSYQWEVSADGENWEIRNQQGSTDLDYVPSGILNNAANYFLTPEDEGKQIRANISYIDGRGNEELLTTDAFDIATRIDLTDENIRRFDLGSVDNINQINFSTLDEKFYRRFDWEEVNYEQINILARDDIAWDKVVFRKATRSDNFNIDAVDWDEVNESKYAKSIYRTIDWNDVDYAYMSDELKAALDWSQVQMKEAKRSDSFSIDAVDWDDVNESKYARKIYSAVDWDDVDYAYMSDELKEDLDWSKVQLKEAKKSDVFSVDLIDWDEVNESKYAKGIYRNLDADDLGELSTDTLFKLEGSGLLSRKMKGEIRSKINDSIIGGSETEPVFDLRNLDFDQVKLDLSFLNESDKDLEFGIYVIENLNGAVKDPITGDLITPGSVGYAEAALDENNLWDYLSTINEDGTKLENASARYEEEEGIDMFATYLTDNLTGETYFAFDEANADGEKFFKSFGDGTIGIKDDKNNDDFDDLIVSLDLQSL